MPKNTSNSCSIFDERYLWYKHAKKTQEKWGTPIYVQLAIIKMESDFDWLAKPSIDKKYLKSYPSKDLQAHLVIHKLLKELGNSTKMRLEIN